MAIASLVLGLIALLGGLAGWPGVLCGILAIVFGAIGRKDNGNLGNCSWRYCVVRRLNYFACRWRRDYWCSSAFVVIINFKIKIP